jgi:hypothetical protein
MTVPAYKRGEARTEFVRQGRVVMKETQKLMRKWPKSRLVSETQFVLKTAYEIHEAAVMADTIYGVVPSEFANRLTYLYVAYGKINFLASLCDDWIFDTPTVRAKKKNVQDDKEQYVPAASIKQLENFAGTLYHAKAVFKGAIERTRKDLKKSLKTYPNFQLTLPIVDAELYQPECHPGCNNNEKKPDTKKRKKT